MMIPSLRYLDHFVKGGACYFEARAFIVDWNETRDSAP